MSFSSDVKTELCKLKPAKCCIYAELYGILLFSGKFNNSKEFYKTDRLDVCEKCSKYIKNVYGFLPQSSLQDGLYTLSSSIINVANVFTDIVTKEYITDAFYCDNCLSAFTRGAFISAGTITDPQKDFHAEIKTKNEGIALSLEALLKTNGLKPHISKRKNVYTVYFKGSENVSDLVTFMGVGNKSLEIIDQGVMRDMRSRVNRLKNCETANIGKTVNASVRQTIAIEYLKKSGKLQNLSEELIFAAKLREDNPDLSLTELSKICNISKSGLNHRLNKLVEIYNSSKE